MAMKFKAVVVDYSRNLHILACLEDATGDITHHVPPVQLVMKKDEDAGIQEPTLNLDMGSAQNLFDAMFQAGMRPTNLADPRNDIKRIDDHLQDMRKLVFKDFG
jgi:hypothetical protein